MTYEWFIEDVFSAHPDLYLEHCAAMAVAVTADRSAPVFQVNIEGFALPDLAGNSFELHLRWTEATHRDARRVLNSEQRPPLVERGSIALAALLFAHLIPKSSIRVSRRGEVADYWLPELRCALEISGTDSAQLFSRRCREKAEQVRANPRGWPGYSFVVCFDESHRTIEWVLHSATEFLLSEV